MFRSTKSALWWAVLFYLVIVFAITLLTGIAPLWQFGVAAILCTAAVPIFLWLDKRTFNTNAGSPDADLDSLLAFLDLRQRWWRLASHTWVGRQVQIIEDVSDVQDVHGKSVNLYQGMFGEIIDLNDDPVAPFRVKIVEHPYPVDVLVQHIRLVPSNGTSLVTEV